MHSQTHATLLVRLREASDPLAWEEFYERYWRLIYATARHRCCSDHTAEEIVQEAMLAVFKGRGAFRYDPARGRFRDWLGTVVRNAVAARRRGPADRPQPLADDAPLAAIADAAGTRPTPPVGRWCRSRSSSGSGSATIPTCSTSSTWAVPTRCSSI